MYILTIILILLQFGIIFIPMTEGVKNVLKVVAVIVAVILLLAVLGVLAPFGLKVN